MNTYMFLWRNKKNIYLIPLFIKSYVDRHGITVRQTLTANNELVTSRQECYIIERLLKMMLNRIHPSTPQKWHHSYREEGYPHNIFLFLDENICCGYSLEGPHRGASNEYP